MITFANELSKHTKSHSVVSLAKETGIDRTLLQKIVTGDRNPSKLEDVIAISKALMLSPINHTALLTAYKIDKIGLGIYNRRKLVKSFFELPPMHTNSLSSHSQSKNHFSNTLLFHEDAPPVSPYFGIDEIKKITTEVLAHCSKGSQNPVYLMFTTIRPDFIELLKFILYSFPNIHVKQLICMQQEVSKDSDNHYNLECFNQIFPLLFYGHTYEAYIYYGEPEVMSNLIMPHYLITADSVISYSSDYSSALLFSKNKKSMVHPQNNPDLITFYRQEIFNMLQASSPLFQPLCENLISYLDWSASSSSNNITSFNISSIPCLGYFLTPILAKKYIKPGYHQKKELILALAKRNHLLKTKPFRTTIFFTKEGLQKFVDTGVLSDCPEEIYEKPEEKDRLSTLISAYDAIQSGVVIPYMIDTTKLHLSPLLKAAVYNNKIDQLFLILDIPQKGFQQFLLLESSISNSFIDFIKHLPESDYVLPAEFAHKCFQDAIFQLKGKS